MSVCNGEQSFLLFPFLTILIQNTQEFKYSVFFVFFCLLYFCASLVFVVHIFILHLINSAQLCGRVCVMDFFSSFSHFRQSLGENRKQQLQREA